jgi:hypothetical protein
LKSIPVSPTSTPDELCHALKQFVEKIGVALVARPYNPFDTRETTWWLVPSTDFPAHRFGKYSVRWADGGDRAILLGMEVEKGVGPSAAPFFRSAKGRRLVMSDDWRWFNFVEGVRDGRFPKALSEAARSVDAEVLIRVTLGMINDPDSFDPDSPSLPRSHWVFAWDAANRSIEWRSSRGATELAPFMAESRTLPDLIDHIDAAENRDWLWGKFVSCVTLQPEASASGSAVENRLWTKFLSHFRQWV